MEKWPGFVMEKISVWGKMNSDWIDNFPRDKLLILSYSQLVSDLPGQLRRLASFLKISLTDADMDCVVTNSQGVFKREKKSQRITLSKDIQLKVESVKLNVTLKAGGLILMMILSSFTTLFSSSFSSLIKSLIFFSVRSPP